MNDCECHFELDSANLCSSFLPRVTESYKLPCSDAAAFLKQLDHHSNTAAAPTHKVLYTLMNFKSNGLYTNREWETPAKAAAKIQIYMKDPNLLPKKEPLYL